jgi:hypothetical protein
MEDLKHDTEKLYDELCECKYNLYKADDIIVSFKFTDDEIKEKILNSTTYYHNHLRLTDIIENVHDLCWDGLYDNTIETLNEGISKDMIPFEELWVNDEWVFQISYNSGIDEIDELINKSKKRPPKDYSYYDKVPNNTYLKIQDKNGYLPLDKKREILLHLGNVKNYFINRFQYIEKYERITGKHFSCDKEDTEDNIEFIKETLNKIEKAPINKLELANKRLELSKLCLCEDILTMIAEYYTMIKI